MAENADVAAEAFRGRLESVHRNRLRDNHSLVGMSRKSGGKLTQLCLADQDHPINRVPVDPIGPLVQLVAMEARDNPAGLRHSGDGGQKLAGPLEEDHVVALEKVS